MLRKLTTLLLPLALLLTGTLQAKVEHESRPALGSHDFEVEDFHTYFVGESGVWVHNSGGNECQRVFSVYERIREKKFPGDPMKAFQETLEKMPHMTSKVKAHSVEGVQDELKRLFDSGDLDDHLRRLGVDPLDNKFKKNEAFVGARFEKHKGKTLRRGIPPDDFLDEADQIWDAMGPVPRDRFNWDDFRGAIDHHFNKQNTNTVIDVIGLSTTQKKQILSYLKAKDPTGTRYVVLDSWKS